MSRIDKVGLHTSLWVSHLHRTAGLELALGEELKKNPSLGTLAVHATPRSGPVENGCLLCRRLPGLIS